MRILTSLSVDKNFMYSNQDGAISSLNDKPLEFVDQFIYLGSKKALIYPWYTNTEHNGKKDKIKAFVHTRTFNLLFIWYA